MDDTFCVLEKVHPVPVDGKWEKGSLCLRGAKLLHFPRISLLSSSLDNQICFNFNFIHLNNFLYFLKEITNDTELHLPMLRIDDKNNYGNFT